MRKEKYETFSGSVRIRSTRGSGGSVGGAGWRGRGRGSRGESDAASSRQRLLISVAVAACAGARRARVMPPPVRLGAFTPRVYNASSMLPWASETRQPVPRYIGLAAGSADRAGRHASCSNTYYVCAIMYMNVFGGWLVFSVNVLCFIWTVVKGKCFILASIYLINLFSCYKWRHSVSFKKLFWGTNFKR